MSLALLAAVRATALPEQEGRTEQEQPKATVYVFRPVSTEGGLGDPRPLVFCDEIPLGSLKNGRYFVAKVDPGRHAIRSERSVLEQEFVAGGEYYVRVGIVTAFPRGRSVLQLVIPGEGANDIQLLKPVADEEITDRTRVVAAAFPHDGFYPPGFAPGFPPRPKHGSDPGTEEIPGLTVGTRVRVTKMTIRGWMGKEWIPETETGEYVGVDDRLLRLRRSSDQRLLLVERARIVQIQVREGRHSRLKGTVSGAGTGLLVGFLGVYFTGCTEGADDKRARYACSGKGFATIEAVSTGLGALIGLAWPGGVWHDVPLDRVRVGVAPIRERGIAVGLSFAF